MKPTGMPSESLEARDVRLAHFVKQIVEQPERIPNIPPAAIKAGVLFCIKRLLGFRMGGRSGPLVALSALLWKADRASLSFLWKPDPDELNPFDVEGLLAVSFSIAADPSYIWPEWAIVVIGVIVARVMPDVDQEPAVKAEILAQTRLRLSQLSGTGLPLPAASVSRTARLLLEAWDGGFPSGIESIAIACEEAWPVPPIGFEVPDDQLQVEVERLDQIMPAWYTQHDRMLYRISLERKRAWLIDKVKFE